MAASRHRLVEVSHQQVYLFRSKLEVLASCIQTPVKVAFDVRSSQTEYLVLDNHPKVVEFV